MSASSESGRGGTDWKKTVLVAGGAAIVAVGAAVLVTLAVTHTSAVTENAIAYVNGYTDGLLDGVRACEFGLLEGCSSNF